MTFKSILRLAPKLQTFRSEKTLEKALKKDPLTSYLPPDTIKKTASVFAKQRLTQEQVRDKVTEVVEKSSFKSVNDASNTWSDLVFALEKLK